VRYSLHSVRLRNRPDLLFRIRSPQTLHQNSLLCWMRDSLARLVAVLFSRDPPYLIVTLQLSVYVQRKVAETGRPLPGYGTGMARRSTLLSRRLRMPKPLLPGRKLIKSSDSCFMYRLQSTHSPSDFHNTTVHPLSPLHSGTTY
jgi:hypothetical protein